MLVRSRLGQGIFRVQVLDAYRRACAVSEEHSLPVLEAAHIRPFAQGGPHNVRNGLTLRSDLHRLFDLGYVTVDSEHRLVVSRRLADDFGNGRSYRGFHGRPLALPADPAHRPAQSSSPGTGTASTSADGRDTLPSAVVFLIVGSCGR